MEEKSDRSKSERRKKDDVKSKSVSKADAIRSSKMPEWQKREALISIGAIDAPKDSLKGKVSFRVYVKVREVHERYHRAMLAYPKASGVSVASIQEWEKIFKGF